MLKAFLIGIYRGIVGIFVGRNIFWHVLAWIITYCLVVSGLDWQYRVITRGDIASILGLAAGSIGFFEPVLLPLILFFYAKVKHQKKLQDTSLRVFQVVIIAVIVIATYKALTGRDHPGIQRNFFNTVIEVVDNSYNFNFGFWRQSIFYGWPSSHTGVAFASSVFLALQFKNKKWVGFVACFYAVFIGLGASVSFHWLSDVIAGAIIGSLIGYTVYHLPSQKQIT